MYLIFLRDTYLSMYFILGLGKGKNLRFRTTLEVSHMCEERQNLRLLDFHGIKS